MTIQNDKTSAHQLWCNILQDQITATLWPKRLQKAKSSFMTSRAECRRQAEEVIGQAIHFENTRLRVVSDEMIARLEASKKVVDILEKEFKSLHPFRFVRLRLLRIEHSKALAVQEAFQAAVLVLVNTPPPNKVTEYVEPQMEVN
jgi:hypothetical protein